MDYLEKLQSLIKKGQYTEFFKLWEEYCYNEDIKPKELITLLENIKTSDMASFFGKFAETAIPMWDKISNSEDKDRVLELIIDLQNTNSLSLHRIVNEFLESKYSKHLYYQELLRLVGLRSGAGADFQYAISRFKLLAHLQVGNFVFHNGGWGVGEIMDVSFLHKKAEIEFEGVLSKKDLSFEIIMKSLVPISSDHFLSRRFGDPDGFEVFAKEKPLEVVKMLLRDLGPKTSKEIKEEIVGLIIQEDDWNRWWQSVKSKLKKDTSVYTPEKINGNFYIRGEQVSHEDSLIENLSKISSERPKDKISVVYSFLKNHSGNLVGGENKEFVINEIKQLNSDVLEENEKKSLEIEKIFLMKDLGCGLSDDNKIFLDNLSVEDVLNAIDNIKALSIQKCLLLYFKDKNQSDWEKVFIDVFFVTNSSLLRDTVFKEIKTNKKSYESLKDKVLEAANHPTMFPEAFCWVFLKLGTKNTIFDNEDKNLLRFFLEAGFAFIYEVGFNESLKVLGKKIYQFLVADRYLFIRNVIEGASLDYTKEMLLLSSKCQQFTSYDYSALQGIAEVVHPNLKKQEAVVEEEVYWTTGDSYKRAKNKLETLAGKDTIENAKEIEFARSLGDLRENSEYKFALEKRDRLQEEIRVLSDQLNKSRILTKEDIDIESISVGCKVLLQDDNNNLIQYVILGPWDTDPENNVLSLQSKFAKAMIGKRVGEEFLFQDKNYKVKEIDAFLV